MELFLMYYVHQCFDTVSLVTHCDRKGIWPVKILLQLLLTVFTWVTWHNLIFITLSIIIVWSLVYFTTFYYLFQCD